VQQFDARILENRPVAESWRELVLSWEAEAPEPGQFLTLRASSFSDPLLRRPFAFAGHEGAEPRTSADSKGAGATVSVVYQVRGGATRLLSELAPGSSVDALGPLGRGFPLPAEGETPIVAGGGIGLGPLLFLDAALRAAGRRPLAALGFRSAAMVPGLELPAGAAVCTDDGSAGFHGTPVDWISRNVPSVQGDAPGACVRLYGCGPLPMLAALAELAAARGWGASLSAEQWMACGVGACMGCALPRADGSGYLRACADGPVFDSREIDWRARP
jgi:dihydroorotate dehydrogenase electron transfer subunit